jgi:ATP-dependent helicase YprA (DUF1998 family)
LKASVRAFLANAFPITTPLFRRDDGRSLIDELVEAPTSTLIGTDTGSGKTECFLLSMLDYCAQTNVRGIKAIACSCCAIS